MIHRAFPILAVPGTAVIGLHLQAGYTRWLAMRGIGEVIDGAMEYAPQALRKSMFRGTGKIQLGARKPSMLKFSPYFRGRRPSPRTPWRGGVRGRKDRARLLLALNRFPAASG